MSNLQRLALASVAKRCARESELFFRRAPCDPQFCFELFRRAIQERLECAWELVYLQYQALVAGWVTRHPAFAASGEEVAYFVNRAFERMWTAVTPEKFARFPNLKSILAYLQMCVHSVVIDHARGREPAAEGEDLEVVEAGPAHSQGSSVEEQVQARAERLALWNRLAACLHGEQERRVIYGSFVLDLKPRELAATYPDTFGSVDEVYRVKQNVFDRLRRDRELLELVGLAA